MGYIKNRADKAVIARLFIGSASYASGSLMIYFFFPTNGNLSYQNINSNKSHQKCRNTAAQILFVLIKAKLKIQLNSKTVINPPPVNAEMKVPLWIHMGKWIAKNIKALINTARYFFLSLKAAFRKSPLKTISSPIAIENTSIMVRIPKDSLTASFPLLKYSFPII